MPKLTLKRLPTLELHEEKSAAGNSLIIGQNRLFEMRVSIPSSKPRKIAKSFIPISKAAQILQVNPDTLRNWEKQGRLIPDRTQGGSRRYNLIELEEMQKQLNTKNKTQVNALITGLSVSKAARLLQVSPDTIRNWDKKGLIASQRASGGARRFSKKLILKLQEEMNIPGAVSPDQPKNSNNRSSRTNVIHYSLAVILFLFIMSAGVSIGLYTGFQIMDKLDKVNSNTNFINQKVAGIQTEMDEVLEMTDQIRQLSTNVKISSSTFNRQQINSDTKVLGESTDAVNQIMLKGSTIVEGLLTAPNIIYGLIAGDNVVISGGQTPKISLKLPALVSSLGGLSGDLKLIGGNDIAVDGLVISDTSTLFSVRDRGGCDNCLIDSDIQDSISISYDGHVDAGSIKQGELSPEHGGTGLSSFLAGDLLFADSTTSFSALSAGNQGSTMIIGTSGNPMWSDSLTVDSSTGNVGIGTTNPSAPFEVKGTGTGATIAKFTDVNTTGCTLATGGTISCSSDVNLKKNIDDLNYGLDAVMSLRPVWYNWKTESDAITKNLGFIAQEVEQVIPKLVTTESETGLKSLNTIGMIPVLVKSIQELATEVSSSYHLTLDIVAVLKDTDLRLNNLESSISATLFTSEEFPSSFATASADRSLPPSEESSTSAQQSASSSATPSAGLAEVGSPREASSKTGEAGSQQSVDNLNLTLEPPMEATLSGSLLTYETATFSKTLKSLGETLVGTVIAAGDIVQDGTLFLTDGNAINALPTLFIQKSDLTALVDFFNGMVTIDKTGTVKAKTAEVSELKIKGGKTSGNAKITLGEKSVEIDNLIVSTRSRILVTPTTETDTVLAVTAKEEAKKFTVTASKNASKDITFDWWLINEVD